MKAGRMVNAAATIGIDGGKPTFDERGRALPQHAVELDAFDGCEIMQRDHQERHAGAPHRRHMVFKTEITGLDAERIGKPLPVETELDAMGHARQVEFGKTCLAGGEPHRAAHRADIFLQHADEIEIRPLFELADFGEIVTPETAAQWDRLKAESEGQA